MSDNILRQKLIRLAQAHPEFQGHLKPLLQRSAAMSKKAGYSHRWSMNRDFTLQEWAKLIRVAKKIVREAMKRDGIPIRGPMGSGRPTFTSNDISLNGDRDVGDDFESFDLSREQYNDFCKTGRRPYDAVVVSILAYIKRNIPDVLEIQSDGGPSAIRRVY